MFEGLNKKEKNQNDEEDFDIQELLNKYPPYFSSDEIVEAEFAKESEGEKEVLKSILEEYFEAQTKKKEEDEYKKELARVKTWEEYQREMRREERTKTKEERFEVLQEIKKEMTPKFVNYQKSLHNYEYYLKPLSWWVGFSAKILAKKYFTTIEKKPSSKELKNLKDELKEYYYDERKFEESQRNFSGNKNFYESLREQQKDEDYSDGGDDESYMDDEKED